MKDGINIEQGTHEELTLVGGMYHSMVYAQQLQPLSDLAEDGTEDIVFSPIENIGSRGYSIYQSDDSEDQESGQKSKEVGFFRAFCVFAYEQRRHWILYIFIIIGAVGAGCKTVHIHFKTSAYKTIAGYALQSWLFAKLVEVFQFTGQRLVDAANFWALMFFILALAMAAFYGMLGFASNSISMVHQAHSLPSWRKGLTGPSSLSPRIVRTIFSISSENLCYTLTERKMPLVAWSRSYQQIQGNCRSYSAQRVYFLSFLFSMLLGV
jgi:hypothetical protein